MSSRLPISLIIPTRNCAEQLRAVQAEIVSLFPLVEEVLAVDSESADGTADLLREMLRAHPGSRFMTHPPGLYESWNAAVSISTGRWIYFATVGDTIDPRGLNQLWHWAETTAAVVLITPPRMVDLYGVPLFERWPVHLLASEHCSANEPVVLDSLTAAFWFHGFLPASALGSSASNLYHGDTLRQTLFPTSYQRAGDTAWALALCLRERVAVAPAQLARFVVAPGPAANANAAAQVRLLQDLFQLSQALLRRAGAPFVPLADRLALQYEPRLSLGNWLVEISECLQAANHTLTERGRYVEVLEKENLRLQEEVQRLGQVPFTSLAPPLRMRHLAPLLRRLRPGAK